MHISFMTLFNTKSNCPHPGRARWTSILLYCGLINDLEYTEYVTIPGRKRLQINLFSVTWVIWVLMGN